MCATSCEDMYNFESMEQSFKYKRQFNNMYSIIDNFLNQSHNKYR
jgi:hypothetical protein